jgi:RNA polymerase sigma factor (TIGR02999 family)
MKPHAPEDAKQSLPEDAEELSREEVSQLLLDWNDGNPAARDRLVTLVYGELRRMAHRRLQRERIGHTMQTGTLAHEVYLRLFKANSVPCRNRQEFFWIVARLMRQILVEAARKRDCQKRGGDPIHIPFEDATVATPALDPDLIALDEALDALAWNDSELSSVVELHFFAGLTIEETAEILGVSTHTVKRRWQRAKIYLHDEMTRTEGVSNGSRAVETD